MQIKRSEITAGMVDGMVKESLVYQQSIQSSRHQRPKWVHNIPPRFDDFVVTEIITGDHKKRSYSKVYVTFLEFFLLQNLGANFLLKMSCCGKLFNVTSCI